MITKQTAIFPYIIDNLEASLKYFTFGSSASAFYLLGIVTIYFGFLFLDVLFTFIYYNSNTITYNCI